MESLGRAGELKIDLNYVPCCDFYGDYSLCTMKPAPSETAPIRKSPVILHITDAGWGKWAIDLTGRRGALPLGAHPGNTGGKKGRSGPKTKKFKSLCRHIVNHPQLQRRFELILKYGEDKDVMTLSKMLAEFVITKPVTNVAMTTSSLEQLIDESQQPPKETA